MQRTPLACEKDGGVDINLSPLIDCVFLLLIFFIVTTVFVKETGVEIDKPQAVSADSLDQQSLQFALTSRGEIYYAGRAITQSSVRGIVARQMRQKALPVVILADGATATDHLVALIDTCKLAGAKAVSVAATPPTAH